MNLNKNTLLLTTFWATVACSANPLVSLEAYGAPLGFATQNLWGLPKPLLKERKRLPEISGRIDALAERGVSFVALQETFARAVRREIAKSKEFPNQIRPDHMHFPRVSSGLFAVTKWKPIETKFRRYKGCVGTDCFATKGAMMSRFENLIVINTHTNAAGGDKVRIKQMNQLCEWVAPVLIQHPEAALVMLGDFNFVPGSAPYVRIRECLGVKDAWQELKPNDPGYSFDPTNNSNAARTKGEAQAQIDFVLYRDGTSLKLKPQTIDLVNTENLPYGKPLSDHYGVAVEFDGTETQAQE